MQRARDATAPAAGDQTSLDNCTRKALMLLLMACSVDSATQRRRQAAARLRDLGEADDASGIAVSPSVCSLRRVHEIRTDCCK